MGRPRCCAKGDDNRPNRVVHLNNRASNEEEEDYPQNTIKTSKYTLLSFVPKNLWEQFRRWANRYFLVIAILQQIPDISPLGGGTTAMTLGVVLAFTAVKEAMEDIKRHRNDSDINHSKTHVRDDGKYKEVEWRAVKVGDIVHVQKGEFFPADILVLQTSEMMGMCYVETSNLDGETNLKIRQAMAETASVDESDIDALKGVLVCDLPNADMYTFNGQLEITANPADSSFSVGPKLSIENKQILLRGSQLRNTAWINGLVVYTGPDCKLTKSAKKPRLKRSNVERTTNVLIGMILCFQMVLCLIGAIGSGLWDGAHADTDVYLRLTSTSELTAGDKFLNGFKSLLTFVILLANLIPISLYVSMEMVKFLQAGWIASDLNVYDASKDMPTICRTSNLNEELGQVEYVFSDKTGTLTQNRMEFKKVSIGGVAYGESTGGFPHAGNSSDSSGDGGGGGGGGGTPDMSKLLGGLTGKGGRKGKKAGKKSKQSKKAKQASSSSVSGGGGTSGGGGGAGGASARKGATGRFAQRDFPHVCFHDEGLRLETDMDQGGDQGQIIDEFMTLLTVCHTVIPEYSGVHASPNSRVEANLSKDHDDDVKVELDYQAASPDEGALVWAGNFFGYVFSDRSASGVKVKVNGGGDGGDDSDERYYEVLAVNEFNSTRKRMSVVVRCPDGLARVMCKGADSVIMELVDPSVDGFDEIRSATLEHLDLFAVEGLRTLICAQRVVPEDELSSWLSTYKAAALDLERRKELLAEAAAEIERDLVILGATAIEDKLQDEVPKTIEKLRKAGIKVWVLTGDKQETAIMIGYSCRLLSHEMGLLVLHDDSEADIDLREREALAIANLREYLEVIDGKRPVPLPDKQSYETLPTGGAGGKAKSKGKGKAKAKGSGSSSSAGSSSATKSSSSGGYSSSSTLTAIKAARASLAGQGGLGNDLGASLGMPMGGPKVNSFALVLDGWTLKLVLGSADPEAAAAEDTAKDTRAELRDLFLEVASRCKSVICCRVSPAQKAQVVATVQTAFDPVTLAIGDGANDVDMIKEAHLGVGISGLEGQQAALAADYAIGQFRFLQDLLLVHGLWCYHRIAKLIMYCFYKNLAASMIPFWFMFVNGYSGQTFAEKWSLSLYNVVFTAFPILVVGIFDQPLPRKVLLKHPRLYETGIAGRFFSPVIFLGWLLSSVWHSIVCYYFVQWVIDHGVVTADGRTFGLFFNGTFMLTLVVFVTNLKLCLETNTWNWIFGVMLAVSAVCTAGWILIWSVIGGAVLGAWDMFYVGVRLYASPVFYFGLIVLPVVALLPDVLFKYLRYEFFPTPYEHAKRMNHESHSVLASIISVASFHKFFGTGQLKTVPTGYGFTAAPDGDGDRLAAYTAALAVEAGSMVPSKSTRSTPSVASTATTMSSTSCDNTTTASSAYSSSSYGGGGGGTYSS